MSNNVVPLFGANNVPSKTPFRDIDVTELISMIFDWAEYQGADIHNDIGFQVRCADFMTYLQLLAKEGERKTA